MTIDARWVILGPHANIQRFLWKNLAVVIMTVIKVGTAIAVLEKILDPLKPPRKNLVSEKVGSSKNLLVEELLNHASDHHHVFSSTTCHSLFPYNTLRRPHQKSLSASANSRTPLLFQYNTITTIDQ